MLTQLTTLSISFFFSNNGVFMESSVNSPVFPGEKFCLANWKVRGFFIFNLERKNFYLRQQNVVLLESLLFLCLLLEIFP